MKKLSLLVLALTTIAMLQAQWVDDPISNTRIANCANGAAEVYVSTDSSTGDSYVQWHYQGENGWSPWLQRLDDNNGLLTESMSPRPTSPLGRQAIP